MRRYVLGIALATAVSSSSARAAQFVVFDATWEHTANIPDSHYYPNLRAGLPANWVAPVNYSTGTAYVHLEVLTKPTRTLTRFQVCFEGTPTYACTAQSEPYATTGVLSWGTAFSALWVPPSTTMNWTQGVDKVAVILKDTENNKPSADNVGDAEAARYMPTRVRMVVTVVTQGSTYVPPGPYDAGAPAKDSGTDARSDAGAPAKDSGTDAHSDAEADASPGLDRDASADAPDSTGVPNPADSSADSSEAKDAGVSSTPGGAKRANNGDDDGCSFASAPPSGSSQVVALGLVVLAGLRRCRGRRAR
jgi:hypothetical protein